MTDIVLDGYTYDPDDPANVAMPVCEPESKQSPGGTEDLVLLLAAPSEQLGGGGHIRDIRFTLPKAGLVKLEVFDVAGRKVATLVDEWREAGSHTANFDTMRESAGVYFARLQLGAQVATRRITVLH